MNTIMSYIIGGAAALICISFHEFSHGLIAYKLGDPTAKDSGRLTLNPLKHVDIIGMILLIVAGFGWAKPVPVDTRYFKNPKRGMALTSLAGPVSNILLAFVSILLIGVAMLFNNVLADYAVTFLYTIANISVGLGIFNLIPIPPLDGSKLLFSLMPDKVYYYVLKYERFGMLALFVLLNTGVLSPYLTMARSTVLNVLFAVASPLFQWL